MALADGRDGASAATRRRQVVIDVVRDLQDLVDGHASDRLGGSDGGLDLGIQPRDPPVVEDVVRDVQVLDLGAHRLVEDRWFAVALLLVVEDVSQPLDG